MTPPPQDEPAACSVARQNWARQTLGIPVDATEDEVQALLLDRLEEAALVPSPDWTQAIRQLADSTGRCQPSPTECDAFLPARQRQWQAEVEAFAGRFFSLTPAERRRQWDGLMAQCRAFAPLELRLRLLERGVDVELPKPEAGSRQVGLLIRHLGKAFVLNPAQRDALHRDFWRQIAADAGAIRAWRKAARQIRRIYPQAGQLDREFLDALADGWSKGGLLFWQVKRTRAAGKAAVSVRASGGGSGGGFWKYLIILVIASSLSRACNDATRTSTPSRLSTPPPSQLPKPDWSKLDKESADALKRLLSSPPGAGRSDGKKPADLEKLRIGEAIKRLYGLPPSPQTSPPGPSQPGSDGKKLAEEPPAKPASTRPPNTAGPASDVELPGLPLDAPSPKGRPQ